MYRAIKSVHIIIADFPTRIFPTHLTNSNGCIIIGSVIPG